MTPEEREATFQAIVLKLPHVGDPHKIEELSLLALAMLLRRAESAAFKAELSHRVQAIVAKAHTPEQIHLAAQQCLKILEEAKAKRRPRPSRPSGDEERSVKTWVTMGLFVMLAVVGGAVWWGVSSTEDEPGLSESAQFVEQMIAAAKGSGPATHLFGGTLSLSSMNGASVVIAENVPPRICAASGMRLVKLGLVSVNGVTPSRVSSAVITELCNKESGNATIMWAPKEP